MAGKAALASSAAMGTAQLAAGVFYGAPPDLHDKVEKLLARRLAR